MKEFSRNFEFGQILDETPATRPSRRSNLIVLLNDQHRGTIRDNGICCRQATWTAPSDHNVIVHSQCPQPTRDFSANAITGSRLVTTKPVTSLRSNTHIACVFTFSANSLS